MTKYAFAAQYYRDAFPFVASDATRANLAGILYGADGTIVATDGHTLLAMQLDAANHVAPPRDVIIPASKALFNACKAAKRDATKYYVVIDQPNPTSRDVTIGVVHAETAADALAPGATVMFTLRTKLHDAAIPAWREEVPTMPEQAPACAPTFRARSLAKFGRVARNGSIRVIPASDERSAAYVYLGRDDAFGILMPRGYGISTARRAAGLLSPLPAVPAWALAV